MLQQLLLVLGKKSFRSNWKAIQTANIGVNPNNDGQVNKTIFPPMTVEQRQKQLNKQNQWLIMQKLQLEISDKTLIQNEKIY